MIRLLVVDDSAVMRQAMIAICRKARDIEVTVAADPIIALGKIARQRPDVVLLDIEMPRMDGMTFLRKIMAEDPLPVVVCSAQARSVRALEEGAVDIVVKPPTAEIVETIRAAALARVGRSSRLPVVSCRQPRTDNRQPPSRNIVAIGASTGGTEALRVILESLPPDAPGIVIVQHMPELFTAAFAKRLNETCRIEVKEAVDGDRVLAGRALIAPGNRHLEVWRDGAEYRVRVAFGPVVSRHRPSVDVLFRSVARAASNHGVGVILTGMGCDGAEGMVEMRNAGALTIAQDEATSIVFGMPREAIARGAVHATHALPHIAAAILAAAHSNSH
jgi:two-component system chemotaxis response regulator CheB